MAELVACEFEDSTNCFWNAQEQGNGEGSSFVDIDGTAFYVDSVTLECPENKVPGWLDENGNPQGCVDNNPTPLKPKEEMPAPVPVESVETAAPVQVEELALTGTAEVVTGALVGIALVVAGVVLYLKGRKK